MLDVVRNNSRVHDLTASVSGELFTLGKGEEKVVPHEVAEALREQYPALVTVVGEGALGKAVEQDSKPKTMFLANLTGDPDAPPTIKVKYYNAMVKAHDYVDRENPLAKPHPYKAELKGGQTPIENKNNLPLAKNNLPRTITIPEYTVKELPTPIAMWLLNRENNAPKQWARKRLRPSRPMPDFRPSLRWALDDIRLFLSLQDPKANLGRAEADIIAKNKKASQKQLDALINEEKLLAWKRSFFRLAQLEFRVPSEAEFNAAKEEIAMREAARAEQAAAVRAKVNADNAPQA